jgi:hypothetical protein
VRRADIAAAARITGRVASRAWSARAEVLTAAALLLGWCLVTSAVAALTSPLAWRFSLGLLALSLAGWRLFLRLVLEGFYVLTLDEQRGRRG